MKPDVAGPAKASQSAQVQAPKPSGSPPPLPKQGVTGGEIVAAAAAGGVLGAATTVCLSTLDKLAPVVASLKQGADSAIASINAAYAKYKALLDQRETEKLKKSEERRQAVVSTIRKAQQVASEKYDSLLQWKEETVEEWRFAAIEQINELRDAAIGLINDMANMMDNNGLEPQFADGPGFSESRTTNSRSKAGDLNMLNSTEEGAPQSSVKFPENEYRKTIGSQARRIVSELARLAGPDSMQNPIKKREFEASVNTIIALYEKYGGVKTKDQIAGDLFVAIVRQYREMHSYNKDSGLYDLARLLFNNPDVDTLVAKIIARKNTYYRDTKLFYGEVPVLSPVKK